MDNPSFDQLDLIDPIRRALDKEGYTQPTPIQLEAIPYLLAGDDLLATAQTGTGKTAAFSLPILQRLHSRQRPQDGNIRTLILTPTRELALQIDGNLQAYGRFLSLRSTVVLGGVAMPPQISALRRKPDIVVATPGRLLDLIRQGHARLGGVETLVLDEADRMLDMGFIHDVRRIVQQLPTQRQTMLFSATLPREIATLAADLLHHPARVEITPPASVSVKIDQRLYYVDRDDKRALLTKLLKTPDLNRALVFTRTKHRANRIAKQLSASGISADAIHSNKSQNARQRALAAFDSGRVKVLVATDIVARGIDVDGISHVINYELPNDAESYVHRIGRTARAGASGVALSFCDADEVPLLKGIEKLTRNQLAPVEDNPFHASAVAQLSATPGAAKASSNRSSGGRSSGGRSSGGRSSGGRSSGGNSSRGNSNNGRSNGQRSGESASDRPRRNSRRPFNRPEARPSQAVAG
jgi:ATP-dependent RNA helicase RhlE